MAKWVSSETGILRKNRIEENLDDLLVFGYACKLFRDDEKALYIDQGKHLIPWMGDDALKIDRYDCRGALSALKQYEASREGYDATRWLGLNESERKLEELCDQERYYSLQINEEEEQMYKEEEAKRQMTNAFQYSYEVENKKTEEKGEKDGIPTVPEYNEDEEPYVPLPTLDVPVDIKIPKTIKEYARIEKTALFVCRQGPQMEILIKAKQADNPQFRFLTQNDDLYKFYRHLLAAFKNGRYLAQYETKNDRLKSDVPKEDSEQHYLHPSLLSANAKPVLLCELPVVFIFFTARTRRSPQEFLGVFVYLLLKFVKFLANFLQSVVRLQFNQSVLIWYLKRAHSLLFFGIIILRNVNNFRKIK